MTVTEFLKDRVVYGPLAAGVLWVCYAGSILFADPAGPTNLRGQVVLADHLAFYTAAQLMADGQGAKVYDNAYVEKYQQAMFPPKLWESLEAFRNPPFYAVPFKLTCHWPFAASAWFWFAVGLACFAVGTAWLRRGTPDPYRKQLLWLFAAYPTFGALTYGQNTPYSYAIFAGCYALLVRGHKFPAGLVAGLLFCKPQLLLGLGLWALLDIRRLWPCALGVAVTGAGLVTYSVLIQPVEWAAFVESLGSNVVFDNFDQWKMHNPLAFWRLLLPKGVWPEFEKVHLPLAAATCALLIAGFVKLWRHRRDDVTVMFGGAVAITLLAAPHALIYEWALLGLTGILWRKEWPTDPDRWLQIYAAVMTVLWVSTQFGEFQEMVSPVVVQLSMPVTAWAWFRAVGLLSRPARTLH